MSRSVVSEIDIWTGIIGPDRDDMTIPEAQAVLRWSFSEDATRRMEELGERHNEGELTEAEHEELEAYVNVGQVLAILQAKARLALQHAGLLEGE